MPLASGPTLTRRAFLGTAAAPALAPRAAFAGGGIRLEHAFGEAVLPQPAARVVSLGARPVGVRYWFGDQPFGVWPWAREALGDAQPATISGEVSWRPWPPCSPI